MKPEDAKNKFINTNALVSAGWLGVRFVPDVHGQSEELNRVLGEALAKRYYVIMLGDLVDRGEDNPGVLNRVSQMVERDEGEFILGNHCWKFLRLAKGQPVRPSDELKKTISQFIGDDVTKVNFDENPELLKVAQAALAEHPAVKRWVPHAERAPLWMRVGNIVVAHAAYSQLMEVPYIEDDRLARGLVSHALYGERFKLSSSDEVEVLEKHRLPGTDLVRSFMWTFTVPAGTTAVVGHTIMDNKEVTVIKAPAGGRTVFLDLGCGFAGHALATMDVPIGSLAMAKTEKHAEFSRPVRMVSAVDLAGFFSGRDQEKVRKDDKGKRKP